ARRVWVVGVAVPSGDPVGGGDDVDPGLEDLDVEVLVGEHAVEGQHVGFGGDDLVHRPGGHHADGVQSDELACVAADLLRCVAVQSDQFEVGVRGDAPDHLGADVAGRDLEYSDRRVAGRH